MLNLLTESIDKELAPEKLYSLRALKAPRAAKILARWFMGVSIIFLIILFLPWQQNVRGGGKVTAFDPANRPQTVESVIGGRIKRWHFQEGDYVEKGDTVITITEVKEKYFDPQLLERLNEQIQSKAKSIQSKEEKALALERQIKALFEGKNIKLTQVKAKLEATEVQVKNAENQFARNKKLYEAGNIPLTKFQEFEYKYQGSLADFQNAKSEGARVETEYLDKISKAESDFNNTLSELYEAQAELSKLNNEFSNTQIRSEQYQILAPQSGILVRALKAGIGETLKEGDAVCTIMPEMSDFAVEMYVAANDVPLIKKGSHVRIEFDGWPGLQVSGWPSVSVGTFGGNVKVIDYINVKPGEFRILIVPDTLDQSWPKQLRVGTGIKGWVMLNDVPLWYEIWRQLNRFPPSLYREPLDDIINKKAKESK